MSDRVLIVDDDASMCKLLADGLGRRGFDVAWRTSPGEALSLLRSEDFDVVVTDMSMKDMNGLELCEKIVSARPDTPVIVITAFGSMETAIAAIRVGAYDYITKPFDLEQLFLSVKRAVQHRLLRNEVTRLRRILSESQTFEQIVGASEPMKKVFDLVERVADSESSVLVTGESGTGKELVARALHQRSPRREGPFVAISCAAMPEMLLESELFGHEKGAFTDARAAHDGLFILANGGTLFLDEIGDMPLSLQPKILRALQEKKVRRVGGGVEIPCDARIVAATRRDLEEDVGEKRFREDLFFRINVIHIDLPPLRVRGNDILMLAQHFLEQFAARLGRKVTGLAEAAAEKLLAYDWPGNVRELQNCIERAVALAQYDKITVEDLPEKIRGHRGSHVIVAGSDSSDLMPMDEVERRYILRVLDAVGGNKTLAAQVLGFDRKTLYRKLERYGVTSDAKK
jgi:two-component system response regulator AtoC